VVLTINFLQFKQQPSTAQRLNMVSLALYLFYVLTVTWTHSLPHNSFPRDTPSEGGAASSVKQRLVSARTRFCRNGLLSSEMLNRVFCRLSLGFSYWRIAGRCTLHQINDKELCLTNRYRRRSRFPLNYSLLPSFRKIVDSRLLHRFVFGRYTFF
jgi:hypothetical protein